MNLIDYVSQDWRTLLSPAECMEHEGKFLKFVSQRSCGLACILMALRYYEIFSPGILELYQKAINDNAFSNHGLIHSKAVELIEYYGLQAKSMTVPTPVVAEFINNPQILFIASVGHLFAGRKKHGHLVLLNAKMEPNKADGLFINDPSPFSNKQYFVDMKQFNDHYSQRGVIIWGVK